VRYIATALIRTYRRFICMEYTNYPSLPEGRKRLTALVRAAGDVIRIDDATRLLHLNRSQASKTLSRWVAQGWLRRVGHGAYVAASLDSLGSEHVLDDPWILVPSLFAPAYVGGRTAAQHWDLTEQIFNDIAVMTARLVRRKSERHHGATFSLKHISDGKIFGTKPLWRGHTKVPVSDVHRTVIDLLDDPAIGGGIQHVADCLAAYLRRPDRDDAKLTDYASRLGNGAVFKRLGFLVENDPTCAQLAADCRLLLTKGNAKLDPKLDNSKLITRWRLWVPPFWVASTRL
jgi:predicted transcriptional regulator of viral defense system